MAGCGDFRNALVQDSSEKKLSLLQQHCHRYLLVNNIVTSWACWMHFELLTFHVEGKATQLAGVQKRLLSGMQSLAKGEC